MCGRKFKQLVVGKKRTGSGCQTLGRGEGRPRGRCCQVFEGVCGPRSCCPPAMLSLLIFFPSHPIEVSCQGRWVVGEQCPLRTFTASFIPASHPKSRLERTLLASLPGARGWSVHEAYSSHVRAVLVPTPPTYL